MSKKVLIIDDDPVVRLLLGECLKVSGFEIESHENGKSGLSALQSHASKPDLIFVDLMMPDMTGLEVIKEIRADSSISKIPVVLLSAISDSKIAAKAGATPPDRYLEKPWDMQKLLGTIKELIGNG